LAVLPFLFGPWTHPQKLIGCALPFSQDGLVSKQRIDPCCDIPVPFDSRYPQQDRGNSMTAGLAPACGELVNRFQHGLGQGNGDLLHRYIFVLLVLLPRSVLLMERHLFGIFKVYTVLVVSPAIGTRRGK